MSEQNWNPGDVAMVDGHVAFVWDDECSETQRLTFIYTDSDGDPCSVWAEGSGARPLVVIDAEDREQVERLARDYVAACNAATPPYGVGNVDMEKVANEIATALREFASPTPPRVYRETGSAVAPWPEVGECHSSHIEGHECPQCAWVHEHEWVAWINPANRTVGVPIRCTKCGGRKCDRDDCAEQRHGHSHADEVTP